MPRLKFFRVLATGQLPVSYFFLAKFFSTIEFSSAWKPAKQRNLPGSSGTKGGSGGFQGFLLTSSSFSHPEVQGQITKERILPC